jgi:hypothetical protein
MKGDLRYRLNPLVAGPLNSNTPVVKPPESNNMGAFRIFPYPILFIVLLVATMYFKKSAPK